MKTRRNITAIICCIGVVILLETLALAQEQERRWQLLDRGEETLKEVKKGKLTAHLELFEMRTRVARQITEALRTLSDNFGDKCNGESHLLIQIAGEWRIAEAVPVLSKHVGFRLDPNSFPPFIKYTDSATFPVAEALVSIGDISVVKAMVGNIRDAEEVDTIAISTWILVSVCGHDMAKEILSIERNKAADAKSKQRIASAIELTDDSSSILCRAAGSR